MVSDRNRLSLNCPDETLLAQWDYAKNDPLTPHDVSVGSNREVWWRCAVADDHRWKARVGKRCAGGRCPCCSGRQLSSTNRLSDRAPDIAGELNEELSGVSASELSVGSNRKVWWNCLAGLGHPPWQAPVLRRTGGHRLRGSGCGECRLRATSKQELRLKAELATVLPVDVDRRTVTNLQGRREKVDVVAEDLARGLRLVLEFDGSYWHAGETSLQRDTAKARRLREAGWTVIRIREADLEKTDERYDVAVRWLGDSIDAVAEAAVAVLDHLATLGLVPPATAAEYRGDGVLRASETADRWIRERLGENALKEDRRLQDEAWARMHAALVEFEAASGHCRVPAGIRVEGVELARWVHKQRTLHRRSRLNEHRVQALLKTPSWSFGLVHDETFWDGYQRYLAWTPIRAEGQPVPEGTWDTRTATVWASNLRTRRKDLQAKGADLPADRLDAMAQVPGWSWDPFDDEFGAKVATLRTYVEETGNTLADIKQRDIWRSAKIGTWVNSWRTRRDQLTPSRQAELETLPGWKWNKHEDQWGSTFAELRIFYAEYRVKPSLNAASEGERRLARWKRNNKNRLQRQNTDHANRLRALLAEHGETMT
ncbi:Helicase associated domain protein [Frankia sp. R82]|uniref:zinc-ribbon domain-containing protein n=1 Tax=Frankia sp. R82 TaxID=2950553 RepID=UPI0020430CE1|nr:Helicase associated domain protein [Frankia sp. R82]MCM3886703.1 zinc-ribbon domain-containing protein [Frankia sp. R82]